MSRQLFSRAASLLAAVTLLGGLLTVTAGASASAADIGAMSPGCSRALTAADFIRDRETGMAEVNGGVWAERVSTRITIRRAVAIEPECAYSFSLASYETEGPTWRTSGTQQFIDHATLTLTAANRTGVLEVAGPRCFGQVDLYYGNTVYDGAVQAGHGPLPRYPSVKIAGLIAGFDGGAACPPAIPSADLEIRPCVDGGASAAVRLAVSDGEGSNAFTVWAKTGDGSFAQVGGGVVLPAGAVREATVVVPLVEDVAVGIEVRVNGQVLRTFDAVTADCLPDVPVEPTGKVPSYGMFLVDADPDGAGPRPATRYGVQVEPLPDNDAPTGAQAVPLNTKGGGASPAATMKSLGYTWASPTAAWIGQRFEAGVGVDLSETASGRGGEKALWARTRTSTGASAETLTVVAAVTHDGVYKPGNFAVGGEAAKVKTAGASAYVYFYAPSGR